MQQGADLRRQQIFGQVINEGSYLPQGQSRGMIDSHRQMRTRRGVAWPYETRPVMIVCLPLCHLEPVKSSA